MSQPTIAPNRFFTVAGQSNMHRNKLEKYVASQLKQFEGLLINSVSDLLTHISAKIASANHAFSRCKPTKLDHHKGGYSERVSVVGLGGSTVWSITIHLVKGELTGRIGPDAPASGPDKPEQPAKQRYEIGQQLRLL